MDKQRSAEEALHNYFQREVARAHADGADLASRVLAERTPQVEGGLAFAAVGVLVVIILAASALLATIRQQPGGSPSAGVPTTSVGAIVSGRDGIPSSIGGVPVLRNEEILAAIEAAEDDRPFLIGGWLIYAIPDCTPAVPTIDLVDVCGKGPFLVDVSPRNGEFPPPLDSRLRVVVSRLATPPDGLRRVVLRSHVHDSQTAACLEELQDECTKTLVAEAIVWSD